MSLSPEELTQVREIVRTEVGQRRRGMSVGWIVLLFLALAIGSVLVLHVLVIGGFTVWHLLHPSP